MFWGGIDRDWGGAEKAIFFLGGGGGGVASFRGENSPP